MRGRCFLILWLLGLVGEPLSAQAAALGLGRVSFVQGGAQVRMPEAGTWTEAAINTPLEAGTRFWNPGRSRLELQFSDGSLLRLDLNTSLDILQLQPGVLQAHLGLGRAYINTGRFKNQTLQIDLPEASMTANEESRFQADRAEDGSGAISVFQGSITAVVRASSLRVNAGERLEFSKNRFAVSQLRPPDDWQRWNEARDDQQATAIAQSRHLPPALSVYAQDLYADGEWSQTEEYGYVWYPRVPVGWTPYRIGRWIWISGDYVWISFERWGWAPYHYGRWAYRHGRWCWVPPTPERLYWGPGYVGWLHEPNYIGWVPLAPGDVYYGYGNHGPRSVDLTRVKTWPKNFRPDYQNSRIGEAVTVVTPSEFAAGKPVSVPRSKVAVKVIPRPKNATVGPPKIKPLPSARWVGTPIPQKRQPGAPLTQLPLQAIRDRHPLQRTIRPGQTAPQRPATSTVPKGTRPKVGPGPAIPQATPNVRLPSQVDSERGILKPIPQPPKKSPAVRRPQVQVKPPAQAPAPRVKKSAPLGRQPGLKTPTPQKRSQEQSSRPASDIQEKDSKSRVKRVPSGRFAPSPDENDEKK